MQEGMKHSRLMWWEWRKAGEPEDPTHPLRKIIKLIVRSFGSSKHSKREDGPYCTISGNEPSSVTLYKTGSESQTFCCNFKNLHLCSLNQRLVFQRGPNNQNTVKKMILNLQYISNTPNIFTDSKGSKEKYNLYYG